MTSRSSTTNSCPGQAVSGSNDETWLADVCEPLLERRPQLIGMTVLADTLPGGPADRSISAPGRSRCRHRHGRTRRVRHVPRPAARVQRRGRLRVHERGRTGDDGLADAIAAGDAHPRIPGFWSLEALELLVAQRASSRISTICRCLHTTRYLYRITSKWRRPGFSTSISGRAAHTNASSASPRPSGSATSVRRARISHRAELRHLYDNYGLSKFNFLHDNFANKRGYLDEFIAYFAEHNPGFQWGCAVRPDNVRLDDLKRMRDAGCFSVFCGTDAGSEKILRAMHKMPSTKRSYEFFENCMSLDMPFETNTIIGYPDETPDDLEAALEVVFDALSYGAENSDVSILQPLAGCGGHTRIRTVTRVRRRRGTRHLSSRRGLGAGPVAAGGPDGLRLPALSESAVRVLPTSGATRPLLRQALLLHSPLL